MSEERAVKVGAKHRPTAEDYKEVLDRAEKGDKSVLPRIREILDEFPDMVEEVGDLTRIAKNGMLDMLDGKHLMVREAEERKLAMLVKEIAGPSPTILERLLAEQIGLSWLHVRHVEIKYSHMTRFTLEEGEYSQRCLDRAQKRYLRAIKTLAQVRKLGLPALQVNIATEGGQQINVVDSKGLQEATR